MFGRLFAALGPAGEMLGVHSLVPISVLTDSYKISHHLQYPAATKMIAVGPLCRLGGSRGSEVHSQADTAWLAVWRVSGSLRPGLNRQSHPVLRHEVSEQPASAVVTAKTWTYLDMLTQVYPAELPAQAVDHGGHREG